ETAHGENGFRAAGNDLALRLDGEDPALAVVRDDRDEAHGFRARHPVGIYRHLDRLPLGAGVETRRFHLDPVAIAEHATAHRTAARVPHDEPHGHGRAPRDDALRLFAVDLETRRLLGA